MELKMAFENEDLRNVPDNAEDAVFDAAREEFPPEDRSGKRNEISKEEQDVLKPYFREMGEVPQMTAEQEAEAWKSIDLCLKNIRNELYSFGFILKEHIRILSDPEMSELSDVFPVDPSNPKENFRLDSAKRKSWLAEISLIHEKMTLEFSRCKDSAKLRKLKKEGVGILLKYPALPVQLLEWHDVSQRYLQLFEEGSLTAEKLEEKTLCSPEEFKKAVLSAAASRNDFERWKLKMLETNLRLVITIAKHYQNRGLPFGDMIQEGNLGLMKALEKFNYRLGHRFCTYASWWIKQGVVRAISAQSRTIRLPLHMIATIRKMHSAEQNFIQANGRDPDDQDVAEILEMTVEKVRAIRKMSLQCLSLQAPVSEHDDKTSFEDFLMDQQSDDPMKSYARKALKQRLEEALQQLSERQRQVISMRYGLDGGPVRSLTEVSEAFHITRERVRQIELRTLDKLRKHSDPHTYLDDFFL